MSPFRRRCTSLHNIYSSRKLIAEIGSRSVRHGARVSIWITSYAPGNILRRPKSLNTIHNTTTRRTKYTEPVHPQKASTNSQLGWTTSIHRAAGKHRLGRHVQNHHLRTNVEQLGRRVRTTSRPATPCLLSQIWQTPRNLLHNNGSQRCRYHKGFLCILLRQTSVRHFSKLLP